MYYHVAGARCARVSEQNFTTTHISFPQVSENVGSSVVRTTCTVCICFWLPCTALTGRLSADPEPQKVGIAASQ